MISALGSLAYQFASLPLFLQILIAVPTSVITTCLLTWSITSINFSRSISQFQKRSSSPSSNVQPLSPPLLPYAIPWLGSALSFLNDNPGSFWRTLRAKLINTGANVEVCTILLGGKKAHVVSSAAAVQALFKTKHVTKELFNHQLATQTLGTSKLDAERMWPPSGENQEPEKELDKKETMEALNHEFLLSSAAVNVLTNKFMERFRYELAKADFDHEWKTVDLLSWWKDIMFNASTTAAMGTKILEMNPDLAEQFWAYDSGFLERFYGIPKFVKPSIYHSRDLILNKTQEWVEHVLAEHGGHAPEEPDWEPLLGSNVMRARHRYYERIGLSSRGKAAFDLGFLFALSANVIPVTSWVLVHLLSPVTPDDVLARVQLEVEKTKRPNGDVDVSILAAQPLINSVVHETMRHYVDSLVTRELTMDMNIDGYLLKKGELIMAPSSLSQHDGAFWGPDNVPSAEAWYPERFLKRDPDTGKDMFSTVWTAGKFFPFGGGSAGCPGRVFAKQEMLGAVATFLSQFEIRFVEYLSTDQRGNVKGLGAEESGFPKVKRQYAGNGTLSMEGGIRVQIRRR